MYRTIINLLRKRIPDSSSAVKGHEFEDYIITLFSHQNFKLLEWRNFLAASNGVLPLNNSYPDLELQFVGTRKYRFAVECKWREKFVDGKVPWADTSKIDIYQQYQRQNAIPVFVAIGIGGLPANPEQLFVTPLDKISMHTEVYESDLIPYKRKPTHKFFYDTTQRKLF